MSGKEGGGYHGSIPETGISSLLEVWYRDVRRPNVVVVAPGEELGPTRAADWRVDEEVVEGNTLVHELRTNGGHGLQRAQGRVPRAAQRPILIILSGRSSRRV